MDTLWSRHRSFILSMAITCLVIIGLIYFLRRPEPPKPIVVTTPAPRPTPAPPQVVVDVRGAVVKPGLYTLPKGSRAQDAVNAAGGPTDEANMDRVNLAKLLGDGDQVIVPTRTATSIASGATRVNESPNTPVASPTASRININTASVEELDKLPGIGPTLAQRIVDFRKANGAFRKLEDLKNVSGVGDKLFDQIRDLITIQ